MRRVGVGIGFCQLHVRIFLLYGLVEAEVGLALGGLAATGLGSTRLGDRLNCLRGGLRCALDGILAARIADAKKHRAERRECEEKAQQFAKPERDFRVLRSNLRYNLTT